MRHKATLIISVLLVGSLAIYMFSFRVRFNETALVTTFGSAKQEDVLNEDGKGAGLYFKWPWPIQDVRKYDGRIHVLENRPEEQETRDHQIVIVNAFVAWRIDDPLKFFRKLGHVPKAEKHLRAQLRDARSEIGSFTFDELANADPAKLRIEEAEKAILARLQRVIKENEYGVQVDSVGVKRILLGQSVTKTVFDRMRSTRRRMAEEALAEGNAVATNIRSGADNARDRILAFADRRAQAIRARGVEEAAQYYREFQKSESLAIYLRQLEGLKDTLKHRTTFLLDVETAPFNLFKEQGANGGKETKRSRASRGE